VPAGLTIWAGLTIGAGRAAGVGLGPPVGVRGTGPPGPDQLEPRPGAVGPAGLRLAAARGERGRPAGGPRGVGPVGRGAPRPLRVVQVGPAQRAEVGPARQDDRVDVVVGGDGPDGYHRDPVLAADLVADPVRVGRLVAAPERRPLVADHLPGGDVDAVHAVLGERPADLHRL